MSIQGLKTLVYSLPKPIIFSIGAICGIATIAYVANNLSKYSATLPKEIQERVTDSVRIKKIQEKVTDSDRTTKIQESMGGSSVGIKKIQENVTDAVRIERSLVGSRVKKLIPPDELTISMLGDVAREVNASLIHCSANCALLSRCVLYNLQHGATILAAKNVFPIYVGLDSAEVEKVIFGATLTAVSESLVPKSLVEKGIFGAALTATEMSESLKNLQEVEQCILNYFQKMGERFYIVQVCGYKIPLIGASAHGFNAVVLFDTSKRPYVQFVDAWKTSDYTPKTSVLESRCHNGLFLVSTYPPPRPEKNSVTIEEIS